MAMRFSVTCFLIDIKMKIDQHGDTKFAHLILHKFFCIGDVLFVSEFSRKRKFIISINSSILSFLCYFSNITELLHALLAIFRNEFLQVFGPSGSVIG